MTTIALNKVHVNTTMIFFSRLFESRAACQTNFTSENFSVTLKLQYFRTYQNDVSASVLEYSEYPENDADDMEEVESNGQPHVSHEVENLSLENCNLIKME